MRLFISMSVPESTKKSLSELQQELMDTDTEKALMYPPVDTFHITLFYNGDVPTENDVEKIKVVLKDVASRTSPFPTSIIAKSCFYVGRPKYPRVFVARLVHFKTKYMHQLEFDVRRGMSELGYKTSVWKLDPHFTLGKVPYGVVPNKAYMWRLRDKFTGFMENEIPYMVNDLSLVHSLDNDTGISEHSVLEKFKFNYGTTLL